jgi:hypothetical protein
MPRASRCCYFAFLAAAFLATTFLATTAFGVPSPAPGICRIRCSSQLDRLRPSSSASALAKFSKSSRREMLVCNLMDFRCLGLVCFFMSCLIVRMVGIRASQYEQMKNTVGWQAATWQGSQFLHAIPPCIRGDVGHFPGRSCHVHSRSTILPDLAGPVAVPLRTISFHHFFPPCGFHGLRFATQFLELKLRPCRKLPTAPEH